MKITYGMSKNGRLESAFANIREPEAVLFFVTEEDMLEKAAEAVEEKFPAVPSIGAVGLSYGGKDTNENGVTVVGLSGGIAAVVDVFEEASTRPIKYIRRLQDAFEKVGYVEGQTACLDFCCAGVDMKSVTTLTTFLKDNNIELAGGTSNSQAIAANGKIYPDSCAFMLIKNLNGKVKAYKENIYRPMEGENMRLLVTDAVPEDYKIKQFNGRSAGTVYREALGISDADIKTQTFKNPFGHMLGDEVYLISIKDVDEEGSIVNFRPSNVMDVLAIMEMEDYSEVTDNTIAKMKEDLGSVSAVLSINCLFRYLLFHDQEHYWDTYLSKMCAEFDHAGLLGVGEHYCGQFVNQTMCGLAFE